jgi:BirA family biotin operon repressor/biotin-[acetyl-CoA-carboxylase] ligase
MTRTLRGIGAAATLKWPNDVLIGGRKVCGILAELLPDAAGVVIGSGVNLTLGDQDLPVPTATSLRLEGVEATADAVLTGYVAEVAALLAAFEAANGDADRSGLRAAVTESCDTIGRAVRVELPSRGHLVGAAIGLDPDGRLLVQDENPEPGRDAIAVAAGDVTHLRY